jgi:hypothetical protein
MILPIKKINKRVEKVILTISLVITSHKKALKQELRALKNDISKVMQAVPELVSDVTSSR